MKTAITEEILKVQKVNTRQTFFLFSEFELAKKYILCNYVTIHYTQSTNKIVVLHNFGIT